MQSTQTVSTNAVRDAPTSVCQIPFDKARYTMQLARSTTGNVRTRNKGQSPKHAPSMTLTAHNQPGHHSPTMKPPELEGKTAAMQKLRGSPQICVELIQDFIVGGVAGDDSVMM